MKPACEPSNAEACVKLIPSTVQRVVRSRNGALLVEHGPLRSWASWSLCWPRARWGRASWTASPWPNYSS